MWKLTLPFWVSIQILFAIQVSSEWRGYWNASSYRKLSTIKHSVRKSLFPLRNKQSKNSPLFCSVLILFLLPLKPGCHTEILKQRLQLQHDKTLKTMVHVWGTHEVTAKDGFSELEINLNAAMIHWLKPFNHPLPLLFYWSAYMSLAI